MDRLQKVMAAAGVASRREAEAMIKAGRVTVNGRTAELGSKVDPRRDQIAVDGVPLPPAEAPVYYLVNKPPGVVSTARDTHGRSTVVELVPPAPRVVPVGRLDADTSGLMILTNDGDLTLRVTHPRYGVTKTYEAVVEGRVSHAVAQRLVRGVELEDGSARARAVELLWADSGRSRLEIVMTEGRKREIRRMLDAVGHAVHSLVRTRIGPIEAPDLRPGEWRHLTGDEIGALYAAASDDDH